MLEVYEANEVRQLMKNPSIDLSSLQKHIDSYSRASGDAGASSLEVGSTDIVFTEDRDYMEGLIPDEPTESTSDNHKQEDIVDIDDI